MLNELELYAMVSDEMCDFALDEILKASGSSLKNYTMEYTKKNMRNKMRAIICSSYTTLKTMELEENK